MTKNKARLGEQATGGTTIRLSLFVRAELRKRYGRMSPNDAIALLLEKDAPIRGTSVLEIVNALICRIPFSELAVAFGEIGYDLQSEISASSGEIKIKAIKNEEQSA